MFVHNTWSPEPQLVDRPLREVSSAGQVPLLALFCLSLHLCARDLDPQPLGESFSLAVVTRKAKYPFGSPPMLGAPGQGLQLHLQGQSMPRPPRINQPGLAPDTHSMSIPTLHTNDRGSFSGCALIRGPLPAPLSTSLASYPP